MHQARTSCTLNYSAQRVWAAIGDLRGGRPAGTSGDRCEDGILEFGGVVACSADQKSVTIDMLDSRLPVRSAKIEVVLAEQGLRRTAVTIIMRYRPKYGVLGQAISPLLVKPIIQRMLCRVLLSLDDHLRAEADVGSQEALAPTVLFETRSSLPKTNPDS